jgi:CRISPR-associated protein Cmr3
MRGDASSRRVGLRIEPLDTLFFRDGCPFDAASRAYSGLPSPQTLAGALRTALLAGEGFDFSAFARSMRRPNHPEVRKALESVGASCWILDARFRGPWLGLHRRGSPQMVEPLLAVPATLARAEGRAPDAPGSWARAEPRNDPLPGWTDSGLLPLWRKGKADAKAPGGFLTPAGIRAFLEGGCPDDEYWYEPEDLYGFDHRIGIGVDMDTLTAADSQLYGIRLLALRDRITGRGDGARACLYAEILLPEGSPEDLDPWWEAPIPLGGEGRYARIIPVAPASWPDGASGERSAWVLASPGIFRGRDGRDRWRPDAIPPERLRAAASSAPLAVSGWDVARNGPRPTRFAVPAGAVYYVDGAWEPDADSLCVDEEDVAQGWGFALRGVWSP